MKKTLSAILLGVGLLFGGNELKAQDSDSLFIKIDSLNTGKLNQMVQGRGFYGNSKKWVAFVGCSYYENGDYDKREIHYGERNVLTEVFEINYNSGLINYNINGIFCSDYGNFKNLTREQIYQDREFAERTKRIINACESREKLIEMVKEIAKERGTVKLPQIKQWKKHY